MLFTKNPECKLPYRPSHAFVENPPGYPRITAVTTHASMQLSHPNLQLAQSSREDMGFLETRAENSWKTLSRERNARGYYPLLLLVC